MSPKMKVIGIVSLVVILPILFAAAYYQRTTRSEASASCPSGPISTERVSPSAARITFNTDCAVKAQVYCAIGREGIQFLCGQDAEPTTTHIIETSEVTLSSNTGYFVFVDTQAERRALSYIQASPTDATVGLDASSFDENTIGAESDSPEYDVSLDLNQDGIINGMDLSEFYPESE